MFVCLCSQVTCHIKVTEMALWVKLLATKSGYLSSVPGIHVVKGKTNPLLLPLDLPRTPRILVMHACPSTDDCESETVRTVGLFTLSSGIVLVSLVRLPQKKREMNLR